MKLYSTCLSLLICLVFLLVSNTVDAQTSIKNFALKPPLGFNSFDSYLSSLNESAAYALMDVMAEKYLPYGYEFFVMDAGWYTSAERNAEDIRSRKQSELEPHMFGACSVHKERFPNGIKVLAEYAHKKGLKFGVWLMRGIPRRAVEQNIPIAGFPYNLQDIADTNNICGWSKSNYGIDMAKPGAQEYYNLLINTLAEWGVDFIKVDDVVPNPKEIVAVANAIEDGGHKMLLSLSPGDVHFSTHLPYYRRANMLRVTRDIWDNPLSVEKGFYAWEKFQGMERPGFWPDLDMIPFGRLCVINDADDPIISPELRSRQSEMTKGQMKTFITQRALAASPLFIGGDLLTMDDYSYSLLTNKEMLACNQNGVMGFNVYRAGNVDVWLTPHKTDPTMGWIGIFNRTLSDRDITLTKRDLGLIKYEASYNLTSSYQSYLLEDVWSDKIITIEDEYTFSLSKESTAFFKFQVK
jgi:melibiase-like protein